MQPESAPPAGPAPSRLVVAIDRVSGAVGGAILWLVGVMVALGAFNAVARYLTRSTPLDLSSNAYIELQWYLFSIVFLLGGAYALREDAHVRVDLLYGRLGPRGRAWIDLVGTLVFLIPFSLMMLWASWPSVAASWRVRELSPDPGGLPRYPIKALVLVAFALLLMQGIAELLKRIAVLRGAPAVPIEPHHRPEEV